MNESRIIPLWVSILAGCLLFIMYIVPVGLAFLLCPLTWVIPL